MNDPTAAHERYKDKETRYDEEVYREYANDRIRVTWEPKLCIHYAACLRFAPDVFRPHERPWVDVNAADADDIAKTVERCPTGALHYRRLDDGPQEAGAEPTEVSVQRGGPLFIRGAVRMTDHRGNVIREDTRIALCRCGRSGNKPFCDGTHDTFLFR
jgi:uncharacterized Fe-S cluster protein YjdI/CDGSH-type Zn-finger protein